MRRTKILSIDGGGPLLPTFLLDDIEESTQKRTAELFDLVVATGTGVLVAWLFLQNKPDGKVQSRLGDTLSAYSMLFESKRALDSQITEMFGGQQLSSAKTNFVALCYDCESRDPFYFRSTDACFDARDDYPIDLVIRASLAGPDSLDAVKLKNKHRNRVLISGAILNNNPVTYALHEHWRGQLLNEDDEPIVVSLGSGLHSGSEENRKQQSLFSLTASASSEWINSEAEQLLKNMAPSREVSSAFFRLDMKVDKPLDDYCHSKVEFWNEYSNAAHRLIQTERARLDILYQALTNS